MDIGFRNHWKKKGQNVLPYTKWRSNEETLEQLQSMLWFVKSRNKVFGKMSTVQKVKCHNALHQVVIMESLHTFNSTTGQPELERHKLVDTTQGCLWFGEKDARYNMWYVKVKL